MKAHGPFGYLFGVAMAVYIGWIVFATSPMERITRGCEPVNWAGNLSVSIVAFLNPSWERSTQHAFDRTDYVCTYTVWRLIYGRAWEKAHPGKDLPAERPDQGVPHEQA